MFNHAETDDQNCVIWEKNKDSPREERFSRCHWMSFIMVDVIAFRVPKEKEVSTFRFLIPLESSRFESGTACVFQRKEQRRTRVIETETFFLFC